VDVVDDEQVGAHHGFHLRGDRIDVPVEGDSQGLRQGPQPPQPHHRQRGRGARGSGRGRQRGAQHRGLADPAVPHDQGGAILGEEPADLVELVVSS
jgi:hypothetical protein